MADFERQLINDTLEQNRYNISKTSEQLKISRHALRYRMQRLNINLDAEDETPPAGQRRRGLMTSHSTAITRKSASNLALAFVLLPKPKRERHVRPLRLLPRSGRRGRRSNRAACPPAAPASPPGAGNPPRLRRRASPPSPSPANCSPSSPATASPSPSSTNSSAASKWTWTSTVTKPFEDLEQYCYRVASVVGLLSVEIFGYQDPACRDYAVHLGKALQLTNILRNVRTDAERGRIYLPQSELQRHRVAPDEILRLQYSDRFERLAAAVAAEARKFYALARQTLPPADRRSMIAAELMGSVYWRLLKKLENSRFQVFGPVPTRLNKSQKFLLVLRTW